MQIESLANKYRPRVLADLVGQDALVKAATGWFKRGIVPPAVLLAGNSGCGKTTTSRILARYVNCLNFNQKTLEPCGECRNCTTSSSPDVVEMNIGASRGIDEIRALIEQTKSMPMMGKTRVFTLDECHSLTKQAADALLKLLEDPPKHVMFILCTTNPEKLINTIRGRCQCFQLKPIEPDVMTRRLRVIAKAERFSLKKFDPEGEIMRLICSLSYGQMRDSIQKLDTLISAVEADPDITPEDLLASFAETTESQLEELAADIVVSLHCNDLRATLSSIFQCGTEVRSLLQKLRWLCDYIVRASCGQAKFKPYSARVLTTKARDANLRIHVGFVASLQRTLCEIETQMNSVSIPEDVLIYSALANVTHKTKG